MLEKAIIKIQNLVEEREFNHLQKEEVDDQLYLLYNGKLERYEIPRIRCCEVCSLTSLSEMIKSYLKNESSYLNVELPLVISANGNSIKVYSSISRDYKRQELFECVPIVPHQILNRYVSPEEMIININTCYVENTNTKNFISNISNLYQTTEVKMIDDGIGSKFQISKGAGMEVVSVDPIISLTPIATYPELHQIERQFNVRVNLRGEIALFECDKGIFERKVQDELYKFFCSSFEEEITEGMIVLAV